jgi:hypothetical protein
VLLASSAKQEIRVRSGRDDKGKGRYGPQLRSRDWQNADLSTALRSGRDDKGVGRYGPQQRSRDWQNADLSTALRSGRDRCSPDQKLREQNLQICRQRSGVVEGLRYPTSREKLA